MNSRQEHKWAFNDPESVRLRAAYGANPVPEKCGKCRWFLNRCHPTGPCDPGKRQAEDDAVWSR